MYKVYNNAGKAKYKTAANPSGLIIALMKSRKPGIITL
jgi:hypothetical protein